MELIEVVEKITADGQVHPQSFIWAEKDYQIDSVGRRMNVEKGEHMLVMIQPDNLVLEFFHQHVDDTWFIVRVHHHSTNHRA
ncbi:MAG: hypothetical protein N2D54_08320 [Chloroflexota bacterium]